MADENYKALMSSGWSWPGNGSIEDMPIRRVESPDKENVVVDYRDFDSGVYILNGRFYRAGMNNGQDTYTSDTLAVVVRTDSGANMFAVFHGNGTLESFLVAQSGLYNRIQMSLTTIQNRINDKFTAPIVSKSDAGKFLRVSSAGKWTAEAYELPTEFDSIILKSSTSSSTKKFKITVDDTGTLKAEEVTS